jgi:hypothetical protein
VGVGREMEVAQMVEVGREMEVVQMVEAGIEMGEAPHTPHNDCYQAHTHHTHTEVALEYSLKGEESPQASLL